MPKKKKKKKGKTGRPEKSGDEKTIARIGFPAKQSEIETLEESIQRLRKETRGTIPDINRQFVIRLLIKHLAEQLENKEFSIVNGYLAKQKNYE